jgi:hypothetical protein
MAESLSKAIQSIQLPSSLPADPSHLSQHEWADMNGTKRKAIEDGQRITQSARMFNAMCQREEALKSDIKLLRPFEVEAESLRTQRWFLRWFSAVAGATGGTGALLISVYPSTSIWYGVGAGLAIVGVVLQFITSALG